MGKIDTLSALQAHAKRLDGQSLHQLSKGSRTAQIRACSWIIDTSRQFIDADCLKDLTKLGREAGLETAISRLFASDTVNTSENRPALHWALRGGAGLSGIAFDVKESIEPALEFADKHADGSKYKAIVHIGIGGSDFGPRLIYDAFADLANPSIVMRFCANVDPLDLDRALAGLNPETTLVIGVSKSFGTEETLYNLGRARSWLGEYASSNLALVTANPERAKKWAGSEKTLTFDMPVSVGGRFSMWSAGSLCCMITLGPDVFRKIAKGALAMDEHVQTAAIADNLPMQLALLDFWNATIRREPMRVALAYSSRLRALPTYLQQLEMESNGKSVTPTGSNVEGATAPALWGGEGSIGQHSYHQWLHQGSQSVPAEFILALDAGAEEMGQRALISHCFAQAEVLANGRSLETIQSEEPDLSDEVARQKVHEGNRPSTMMICRDFGPEAFGSLLAMFEHRTYLAGVLWEINSFDQWGVERGKVMAGKISEAVKNGGVVDDPITQSYIEMLK